MDTKYGRISVEHGQIPENEPIFILRAQDCFAVGLLKLYYQMRAITRNDASLDSLLLTIDRFIAWPVKKIPD